jgi:hypothetical protein
MIEGSLTLGFGDIFGGRRTWHRTAQRTTGPFRRTRRTGVLYASLARRPEWPGGPPDSPAPSPVLPNLAPNLSDKLPLHRALVLLRP